MLSAAQLLLVALSMNVVTDGCATSVSKLSQQRFSICIFAREATTFLCGAGVGALSDARGRTLTFRLAYLSYGGANLCFFFGVAARRWEILLLGSVAQGIFSPMWEHMVPFVYDFSPPNKRGAQTLSAVLSAGLYGIFLGATAFAVLSTIVDSAAGAGARAAHCACYAGAVTLAASGYWLLLRRPPASHFEPRVRDDALGRRQLVPCGSFAALVHGRPYLLGQWLVFALLYFSGGWTQSMMVNFIVQRYDVSGAMVILFLLLTYAATGIGLAHGTRWVLSCMSEYHAIAATTFVSVLSAVVVGVAPTYGALYASIPLFAVGAPTVPLVMSLAMRQVGAGEKGELSGVFRATEALAKGLGAVAGGLLYFAPFLEACDRCADETFQPSAGFREARALSGFAQADVRLHGTAPWTAKAGCSAYHESHDILKATNATYTCLDREERKQFWDGVCRGGMDGAMPGEPAFWLGATSMVTLLTIVIVENACGHRNRDLAAANDGSGGSVQQKEEAEERATEAAFVQELAARRTAQSAAMVLRMEPAEKEELLRYRRSQLARWQLSGGPHPTVASAASVPPAAAAGAMVHPAASSGATVEA